MLFFFVWLSSFLGIFLFFLSSFTDATLCLLLDFSPLSLSRDDTWVTSYLLHNSPPSLGGLFSISFRFRRTTYFGISCMIWRGLAFLKAFYAVARELGMG